MRSARSRATASTSPRARPFTAYDSVPTLVVLERTFLLTIEETPYRHRPGRRNHAIQ
ncbi:hypothetical protein MASSI9I_90454 [Massilia sp. 9I]|nr:hypothetical protein MASSI9I_90454 [Massilia sp. 9I]